VCASLRETYERLLFVWAVIVVAAAIAVFVVGWWRTRRYNRKSSIYRGSMVNLSPLDHSEAPSSSEEDQGL
jgi:DNA-binding transcriptional regulator of glucitol operon